MFLFIKNINYINSFWIYYIKCPFSDFKYIVILQVSSMDKSIISVFPVSLWKTLPLPSLKLELELKLSGDRKQQVPHIVDKGRLHKGCPLQGLQGRPLTTWPRLSHVYCSFPDRWTQSTPGRIYIFDHLTILHEYYLISKYNDKSHV